MKKQPGSPQFLRRLTRRIFVSAAVAASMFAAGIVSAQTAEPRVTFSNSLAPLPVAAGTKTATPHVVASRIAALTADQLAAPFAFNVALAMRDLAGFQARVANGETVPFDEMESEYLPLPGDYNAVRAWLVGQGFSVTRDDARRLAIFARGTVAQVQASFAVNMQSVTVDGVTYAAASTAPSLPASIAGPVLGINGLQPYLQARKHSRIVPAGAIPNASNPNPYTVPQIRTAYNASSLTVAGTTLTGANQVIAIIIDTFPLNSDLTTFWSYNGISQSLSNIQEVNVPGGTLDATSGEESLDVEWSSSIAPGDKVRVYASDNLQFSSIDQCLAQLATDVSGTSPAQPNIHQLSMSLGLGEDYLGAGSSEFTTESQYFVTIANGSTAYGGVSVFVSAGDAGSTPDDTGHGTGGPLQAEYESTDPSVCGVGGTALAINGSGARTSEVVWDDTVAGAYYGVGATGGGTSIQFSRPTWQTGTGVPSGTKRLAPDVALVAAGSTPGILILNGDYYYVSGTSWASPTWAAFTALINQGRSVNTTARLALGLLNPRIYPLSGTSNFYDITSGNNAIGANANGNYYANTGYDECTGIGVPNVGVLLATLLGPTVASFNPTSGPAGTSVVITGTNFYNVTSVKFNGTAASSFTVNSTTQITAVAPASVTTGAISVTALGDAAASSTNFTVTVPDLTIAKTHTGNFTQADTGDTYTITVTNSGVGPTIGTVTVADVLPSGLSATGLSGTGWTVAGNYLSATRTDALASGSSYPTLTLTVNVSSTAAASLTNTATVAGGGEANTSNDTASNPTTVIALTPSQAWRYEYFGTTADSGNAADNANPSGDGIVNLLKYALGLNPLTPTATNVTGDTSTGYLRLTVPKNPNATDIIYAVQVTSNLADPGSWTAAGTTVDQNTSTLLQVQDNTAVNEAEPRFIRLQITR
jgi:kumamolisin